MRQIPLPLIYEIDYRNGAIEKTFVGPFHISTILLVDGTHSPGREFETMVFGPNLNSEIDWRSGMECRRCTNIDEAIANHWELVKFYRTNRIKALFWGSIAVGRYI